MSTIYVQYINGNLKISINIKVNQTFFLKVLPEKNRQINEDNFDKRKMFWGYVSRVSRKSDRERN